MRHYKFLIPLCFFAIVPFFLGADPALAVSAKTQYFRAEAAYKKLIKSPRKKKYRENWLACIAKFKAVYTKKPSDPWAPAGMYMTGKLYGELYRISLRQADKREALDIFQRLQKRYPRSKYRYRSKKAAQLLTGKSPSKKVRKPVARKKPARVKPKKVARTPKKDSIQQLIREKQNAYAAPRAKVKRKPGQTVTVSGLRYWSNPNYTRIVIDADDETTFSHRLLKKDPQLKKPQRLYIDLSDSRLGENIQKLIPINDNLLSDARAGQYQKETVRVVVDIKSFKTYKIFPLKNPFRIVIDVWGENGRPATKPKRPPVVAGRKEKLPAGALAKQLALGVRRIVVDAGHGGRDYGAPGYLKGVHEKKVVLSIAQRLARKIRTELGCEVIMTRNSDRYLTLEERTAIANTKNADLFISIHTNSHRDSRAFGIETYFLNLATDDEAIMVAARENATSTKNISDLQAILNDLMHNAKVNESSRLAGYIQSRLYRHMKTKYSRIKNKGVKKAPFYVLLGAHMPAVLIETSFISNPRECRRLVNPAYQEHLCKGIVQGIKKYIRDTNPSAFVNKEPTPSRKG